MLSNIASIVFFQNALIVNFCCFLDETTEQESFPTSQDKLSSTPAKQTKITDHFNNKPAPKVTDL